MTPPERKEYHELISSQVQGRTKKEKGKHGGQVRVSRKHHHFFALPFCSNGTDQVGTKRRMTSTSCCCAMGTIRVRPPTYATPRTGMSPSRRRRWRRSCFARWYIDAHVDFHAMHPQASKQLTRDLKPHAKCRPGAERQATQGGGEAAGGAVPSSPLLRAQSPLPGAGAEPLRAAQRAALQQRVCAGLHR